MSSGSFTLSVSVSVDYMVIRVRCYSIDQNIEYYEYQHADCRYGEQKREIVQVEGHKQIFYHRESKPKMYYGHGQRQEKYCKHLRADALFYVPLCHAYLLHDLKAGLVFIPFRNLLIIDYQSRGEDENYAEHYS